MSVECYASSNMGKVKKANEDHYAVLPPEHPSLPYIIAISDGVGGRKGGQMASVRALQTIGDFLSKQTLTSDNSSFYISLAVNKANQDLLSFGHKYRDYEGLGTTVVLALIFDTKIVFGSVGDSRGYIMDSNKIPMQVTCDHTWTNNLVLDGYLQPDQAKKHPYRHHLTKAIGVSRNIEPDCFVINKEGIESVLLCSDGLTEHLSDMEISTILSKKNVKPQTLIDLLISKAIKKGGTDNITVVLAKLS